MGEQRKVLILLVILCLALSVFSSGTAFASSENWVEVMRISRNGSANFLCGPFVIDSPEWRIKWEFIPPDHWHFADLHFLKITVYPEGELTNYVDQTYGNGNRNSGIHYVHYDPGEFRLKILTGMIESFTVVVEQNLDSIPEFPSWIILPLTMTATLIAVVLKRRCL